MYGILLSRLGWCPQLLLGIVRQATKTECRIVGPSLSASLEPLAHRRNLASLSLFYRYYFGRCSSELAQLVPLPFSRGRSTHYSDRLHDFSLTSNAILIFTRKKNIYTSFSSDCIKIS